MCSKREELNSCPIATAQKIIGGKWTIIILHHLSTGTLRFGELNSLLPNITQATLTKELRALESYQIIKRKVYPEVPPKVEYSLTEIGLKFISVLKQLSQWGNEYNIHVKNNKNE